MFSWVYILQQNEIQFGGVGTVKKAVVKMWQEAVKVRKFVESNFFIHGEKLNK